jgi:hypothetical protein
VIFCEMLLGKPPIPKMDLVEMATAHCKAPRPEITRTQLGEAVPRPLTSFIQKCMAIDPRQRYGTAREALDVLEQIDSQRDAAPVPEVSRYAAPGVDRDTDPSASQVAGQIVEPSSMPPPLPGHISHEHARVVGGHTDPEISEVIHVEIDEPRKIWPWALAAVGLLLVFVGFRLVDALQQRPAPAPAPPTFVAATVVPDAGATKTLDLAAVVVAVDAAVADVAVKVAAVVDARVPDAVTAKEPARPKPKVVVAPLPKPKVVEEPAPPPQPTKIAGLDVTPTSNDQSAALREYQDGLDAQRRGAPKSAQRFYVRALKKGLTGKKAAEAQRRIKQIADATALEASEF